MSDRRDPAELADRMAEKVNEAALRGDYITAELYSEVRDALRDLAGRSPPPDAVDPWRAPFNAVTSAAIRAYETVEALRDEPPPEPRGRA